MFKPAPHFSPRCRFCTGVQRLEGVCRWHEIEFLKSFPDIAEKILREIQVEDAQANFKWFCAQPVNPQDVRQ